MDLKFSDIYDNLDKFIKEPVIDLAEITFCEPWFIGMVCLLAIEYKNNPEKNLILPTSEDFKRYLKRMHFNNFMKEISYEKFVNGLEYINMSERENMNVYEITHSFYRDDFNARLEKIRLMFKNFGMDNQDDINRATVLVGELGNNVFDHNEGLWPSDVRGAIILGQNYPNLKKIEVVVADPGVGFKKSLQLRDPNLNDVESIELGLRGVTGRIGEKRGNGLKLIQDWTINKFNGIVKIHSGNGLVVVDKNGTRSKEVNKILGTLASFVVKYN